MPDIFLSYNREDQPRAKLFAEAFEAQGFEVWWDVGLKAGEAYDEVTEAALRAAKAVVVLWSKKSVASRWVRAEATLADRSKTLVPAMIEACERPIMFELTQTANLAHWQGEVDDNAWLAFLADVRRFVIVDKAVTPAAGVVDPSPSGRRGESASLAVLPFNNRSGLLVDDVFAEGMVEDIIAALSLGGAVRVLASSVTASYKKGAADLAQIGRRLRASYILEGNVRRIGSALRVTCQLVEAESGAVLWTQRFDRPLAELASLQEDLVMEVASSLDVQVERLEYARALKKPGNLTSWEAVIRSHAAYAQMTNESVQIAVREARRAVEISPEYGLAQGALALALAHVYLRNGGDAVFTEAGGCAEAALNLDPHNPQTLQRCALALAFIGRAEDGLQFAERSVAMSPNNAIANFTLAVSYIYLDRNDEALHQLEVEEKLADESFIFYLSLYWRSRALWQAGKTDDALAAIDRSLRLRPLFSSAITMKVIYCAELGQWQGAYALVRQLRNLLPSMERDDFAGVAGRGVSRRIAALAFNAFRTAWDATPAQA